MKAIILAAGRSSRLYPLTLEKPKCILEIKPGKTIIEHQIDTLKKCGINDIVVVIGYLGERIKEVLKDTVKYREFEGFTKYNNLHTLYHVKDELNDDFICLFSDVIFGEKLIRKCIEHDGDFCLLVHNKEVLSGTMRVQIDGEGIINIGSHISVREGDGNFIGIGKFSKQGAYLLVQEMEKMVCNENYDNDYYTTSLIEIAKKHKINYEFVEDEPWIEIDTTEDLERAKSLYSNLVA